MGASLAQRAATADRRRKAIALRLAGAQYEQIAEQLGYADRGAAYNDIRRSLEQNLKEGSADGETLRELNRLRMERLIVASWSAATNGDQKAIETTRRLIESLNKMYGIGTTMRVEHITIDAVDAEIARLQEKLADNDRRLGNVPVGEASTPSRIEA
jgi:hypothetical protein